jgi:hypothetical protein
MVGCLVSRLAAVADPQVDEDELIERIRERSGAAKAMAARWREYALHNRMLGKRERRKGDLFAAALLEYRADVRDQAAGLLLSQSPGDAAAEMMLRAAQHVVRTPPLIDYDAAAISYTIARSWQWCAQQIDPTLSEVQPRWDG